MSLLGCDGQFVRYVFRAYDRDGLRLDVGLIVVGANRTFQGDFAVSRDDLDVVTVGGERVVLHDGAANLLGGVAVGRIHLLVVGRRCPLVSVALILLGVVRLRLRILRDAGREQRRSENQCRAQQGSSLRNPH